MILEGPVLTFSIAFQPVSQGNLPFVLDNVCHYVCAFRCLLRQVAVIRTRAERKAW